MQKEIITAKKERKKKRKEKKKEFDLHPTGLEPSMSPSQVRHTTNEPLCTKHTYTKPLPSQRHTCDDKFPPSLSRRHGLKKGYPVLSRYERRLANNFQLILISEVSSDILRKSRNIWSPFGLMNNWSYM